MKVLFIYWLNLFFFLEVLSIFEYSVGESVNVVILEKNIVVLIVIVNLVNKVLIWLFINISGMNIEMRMRVVVIIVKLIL